MEKVFLYLTKNLPFRFIVLLTFIITGYLEHVYEYFPIIKNLDTWISKNGYLIDIGFLVSVAIISLSIVFYALKLLRKCCFGIINIFKMSIRIKQLNLSEQSVLREFEIQRNVVVNMPKNDSIVNILIKEGFLKFASHVEKEGCFPMLRTNIYMAYGNRALIGIPEDSPDLLIDKNSRFPCDLMHKRPKWADNYYRQNFL
ncbi:super-infection exclusion protein B [Ancylomarina sp.]|uniref:super-infection exclusion protein B n=1 Tax=Ancylomarina sp. TaxID=1970196 RepID=UPI0035613AEE